MDTNTTSRRRFLSTAGAALSAPLAIVGTNAAAGSAEGHGSIEDRLAGLEDANAIRKLHRTYARLINEGAGEEVVKLFADPADADADVDESVSSLSGDGFGEDDVIDLAADRQTATGRFHSTVHTRTAIGPTCTLVEMARAQGEGFIERSDRRVIEAAYVKEAGVWKIRRVAYRRA